MRDFEDLLKPARQLKLLDLTHDTIMIRDPDDRVLYWNKGAEHRYGWSKQEAIGKVVHDLLRTRFPQPLESLLAILKREGRWEGELIHECRNGQELTVASRWVLEPGEGGEPDLIIEINRDISPRKRALEALRHSQESMQVAMEAARTIAWDWSIETATLSLGGCQALLGTLPADPRQAPPESLLGVVHPDDIQLVQQEIRKALQGRGAVSVEFRTLGPDEETRWFALNGRTFLGTTGAPARMTGILQETTDRKALEQQFLASQKLEVVGRLAGGIAHDFNNLLTAIFGFADLGEMETQEDAKLAKIFRGIRLAADRGGELTRQLLGFARRQVISPRIIDVDEAIQSAAPILQKILGERVELDLEPSKIGGCVRIDPGQFDQILANLAANARDAMPQGGTLTIETQGVILSEEYTRKFPEVVPGEYLMVAVSDTGTGMSPEIMKHAFEPFFTTKGKHQGTGLGLATCYGIVKQNHGHIWIYSEPGRGTTFKIYLPQVRSHPEEFQPEDISRDPAVPRGGSETILLVDDDVSVRAMALAALLGAGYTVLEADCGDDAVMRSAEYPQDIQFVLTDVVMPGMKVTDMVDRLRAMRPGLPVLYMSGYTENAIVHQGILDPGLDLLQKPFTAQHLLRTLRKHLDSKR